MYEDYSCKTGIDIFTQMDNHPTTDIPNTTVPSSRINLQTRFDSCFLRANCSSPSDKRKKSKSFRIFTNRKNIIFNDYQTIKPSAFKHMPNTSNVVNKESESIPRSLTDGDLRNRLVNNINNVNFRGGSNIYERLSPGPGFIRRNSLRQIDDNDPNSWNNFQECVKQVGPKTERLFQKGGEKLNKVMQGVKTSFTSISQRLRNSGKRHYQLENTPTRTPRRTPPHSSRITPGKLYGPFDINTPLTPHSYHKGPKRLQHAQHRRPFHENYAMCHTPPPATTNHWVQFGSPARTYVRPNIRSEVVPHKPMVHDYLNVTIGEAHPNAVKIPGSPHFSRHLSVNKTMPSRLHWVKQ